MPFSCAASSASAICRAIASASSIGKPARRRARARRRAGRPASRLRPAPAPAPRDAVDVLDAVDRADVRMIERREHARFALEARQPIGVGDEGRRQDLDRDVAPQLRVARAIHLAHAARAEQRQISYDAEPPADERSAAVASGHQRRDAANRRRREIRPPSGACASSASTSRVAARRRRRRPPPRTPRARAASRSSAASTQRPRPAASASERSSPRLAFSSRSSQSFASRQSRLTCRSNVQHLGGLLDAQAAEEPQLDDADLPRVDRGQAVSARSRATTSDRPVQAQSRARRSNVTRSRAAAALLIAARARMIDEDAPHQPRRDAEEVRAILPAKPVWRRSAGGTLR